MEENLLFYKQLKLENEVWSLDRCAGCGMCVTACSRGRLQFEVGMPHPIFVPKVKTVGLSAVEVDTCSFCDGMCAESCPRLKEWDKQEFIRLYSAKTTRHSKGNAINEIIVDLLSAGLANDYIDAVLIMDVNRWDRKPFARVIKSVEGLYKISGNQGIWTPILSTLYQEVLANGFSKVAIVGPPCVAQAVRRVFDSTIEGLALLRNAIGISIATFCSGFYEEKLLEDLSRQLMVSPSEILSVARSAANNDLQVKLTTGNTEIIPAEEEQKYLRKGCARCTDYLGEISDVSIGQLGSPEGYSTLIAWNSKGKNFIQNCINFGLIETNDRVDQNILLAACSDKERRLRTQAFDSLLIYSLESLTDQTRLEEAKRRFIELFENEEAKSSESPKDYGSGCTGC